MNSTSPQPYEAVVPGTLDLREWMRVFAFERMFRNYDSYVFQRGKNMYAYKPAQSPWQLLMWDIDFIFAQGSTNESLFGGENDALMARLKSHPPFQRVFWAFVKELLDGPFSEAALAPQMAGRFAALTDNGASPSSYAPLLTFVRDRRTFVLQQLADVQSPFAVSLPPVISTNLNYIALTGAAPVEADRITVNGVGWTPEWLSLNQWRVVVPLAEGTNALRVHAVDARGSAIAAAPVDLAIVTSAESEPAAGRVVFSEIMYQPPTSGAAFIELHDASTSTWYDLSRWRIDGVGLTIPDGVVLPPGGFAVFAADRTRFAQTHGAAIPVAAEYPGGLADAGESLALIQPGPTSNETVVVDQVGYENRWPWPTEAAGQGASLQLLDPAADRRRPGHWAAALSGTAGAPAAVLLSKTNIWRYNTGGTHLDPSWVAADFDDAHWAAGGGLFETAGLPAPKTTPLPLTNWAGRRILAFQFRSEFHLAANPANVDLRAPLCVDDGAVIHLNGVEAYRIGMPPGSAGWTTTAARVVGDAVLEGPVALPSDLLVPGRNVIAVQATNTARTAPTSYSASSWWPSLASRRRPRPARPTRSRALCRLCPTCGSTRSSSPTWLARPTTSASGSRGSSSTTPAPTPYRWPAGT